MAAHPAGGACLDGDVLPGVFRGGLVTEEVAERDGGFERLRFAGL